MLAMQRPKLPRPVKGQYVVAALNGSPAAVHMYLLARAIKPGVNDEQRPLAARTIHAMKVSRQRRVLVRNLHRLNRRIEQRSASFVAAHRLRVGVEDSRVTRILMQKELR